MTKIEMLFIRACKSANPSTRLRSVYRRYYCKPLPSEDTTGCIAFILTKLVEKYFKYDLISLLDGLNPDRIIYTEKSSYISRIFREMSRIIRSTESKYLPEDFIKPIMFRREDD